MFDRFVERVGALKPAHIRRDGLKEFFLRFSLLCCTNPCFDASRKHLQGC